MRAFDFLSRCLSFTMKKQASTNKGQKKLTQFFTKKPQQEQSTHKNSSSSGVNHKLYNKDSEIIDVNSFEQNKKHEFGLLSSTSISSSPRKLSQCTLLEFSPTKEDPTFLLKKSSPLKQPSGVLNGRKLSLKNTTPKKILPFKVSPQKKSPKKIFNKSPQKQNQTTLPQFSPRRSPRKLNIDNVLNIENDKSENGIKSTIKNTPHKRKFVGSPLREKQNGLESSSAKILKSDNGVINKSSEWGDEVDFVNLCDDAIVLSPKKIQIKRQKCDEPSSNFKNQLNGEKTKSPPKIKRKIDQNLSQFFQSDSVDKDNRSIKFDKLERYEVVTVIENSKEMQLTLKRLSEDITGVCIVRSPWNECSISAKDVISVKGVEKDGSWVVDWNGLLVLNPDRLISGTTIVSSIYCMRKSVLSHLFKEPGGTKDCMVIGSLIHELFQEVLKQKLRTREKIEALYKDQIKSREFLLAMFLNNVNYEETVNQMESFIDPIHNFMQQYVFGEANKTKSENWSGQIVEVEDIEENIWSPVLGVKGKVDATVEVRINKKNKVMPLELKTGKVSFSIEHRGQVILYCMLLQQIRRNVDSGLLLYLNSGVEMKEIRCEERETRDLTLLRNGLSHWLSKLSLVEAKTEISPPLLPPPINRRTCSSCPYLIPCSAAIRGKELDQLPERHHLKEFAPEAIKHLSEEHMNFIFHWLGLLSLEKCSSTSKISDIWKVNSDFREKSGKCLAQMKMIECLKDGDGGFKATFSKIDGSLLETEFTHGQLIVVSSEGHLALALGVIKSFSPISITLMLDKYIKTEQSIFLDAYEGDSTFTILTNNLTCLLEDSTRAARLRELIIDQKLPTFSSKLSSKIKKVGSDIFDRLNREQVRAVLQAIASENYILIKGMAGSGKTTTMAALIELLTRLKKKVLVTSFTHSAIDNILINLIGKVKMLRLGPEHRVHPKLKDITEHHYVKTLTDVTPAGIETLFSNKEVVGVTCFGSKHPWLERQVFDVCLVDEASQVSLPAVIKPISLAEKFILVGDPKQLPPLVLNEKARELGYDKSLFEWLEKPAVTSPLTLQYRMNSVITALANDLTYGGQLQCANQSVAQAKLALTKELDEALPSWLKNSLSTELDKSVMILDVKCQVPSEVGENKTEASIVVKIIDALVKYGVKGEAVGVISTYSRQVTLLKSLVKENVEVNTVDQYQGRDKEVIIYSTTRSVASLEKKDILSDWRRLTVAVTRAKKKLIILGSIDVLNQYENFAKLISSVSNENIIKVPLNEI